MRRLLVVLSGVVFLAAGCGGVSGPQTYTVGVDAGSPEGKNLQYSTFFPSTLKVSPGDSIRFANRSTQAPHTISFGIDANRSNQPAVILPNGTENPVVQQPCFAEEPPTVQLTKCPHGKLPAYGGTGFWNSGFLSPAIAPSGKNVTLELADSIKPGKYRYICILHGPMAGVIDVVADEADRESTDEVVELGDSQLSKVRDEANAAKAPEVEDGEVGAGWSTGVTAINRFSPQTINVKAGDTVTWEAYSAFEPHTVSFGDKYKSGDPESGSTAPEGIKSGGSYSGGEASSGIFGIKGGPFPPGPFSLRFSKAGEYKYVCLLHPGMVGSVKVS